MHVARLARAGIVALAALVALAAVAPVAADSRVRKIEPRRVVPYKLGRAVTPNTDILSASGYAAWMIDEALEATTPLPRLGAAFMKAEREEGINARTFVAHAILETRWGTSAIAQRKRNLFGYSAYDRDPWRYAARFRSYEQGILAVASRVRDGYLTPGGRWWYGFTTLRAVNRYYASDPRWADKVAGLANVVDQLIVTLRERGLRFGRPTLTTAPTQGAALAVDVPWRARPGAELPPRIRFAVRWTPVALVEASAVGPAVRPATPWTLVRRRDRPADVVRLSLRAPSLPGVWRLEIEARDSDGRPLPETDRPAIRPLVVRVAGAIETDVSLAAADDGSLAATVRNVGRSSIEESGATAPSLVEAWALPLDPALPARQLAVVALESPLAVGASQVLRVPAPEVPAVVVVRLTGDPDALGRERAVAALVTPAPDGPPTIATLPVAGPRDELLLGLPSTGGRIDLRPVDAAGSLQVAVSGGDPVPAIPPEIAGMEDAPGRPWLLLRSLAAEPFDAAAPSQSLLEVPAQPPSPALVGVSGIVPGIRLAMAALVPADGGPADPATIRLAWIPIAAAVEAGDTPN